MITPDEFSDFFIAATGYPPFPWQQRLLDHLLTHGRWPEVINAPTGAGKSSVIHVHAFANALHAVGNGPRVPRRLFAVVGRRALVDNQADLAQTLQSRLDPNGVGVTARVGAALRGLAGAPDWSTQTESQQPLEVVPLRGGMPLNRDWLPDPRSCAVINATPDMFGSRLLLRGYGSGRYARPREAGLCSYDAALVLDEAHLNRQLVYTARRIAALEGNHADQMGVPGLQVVETTATPPATTGRAAVGVISEDLAADPGSALALRMTRPKPVELLTSPAWPGRATSAAHIGFLADQADSAADRVDVSSDRPSTVLCVVNRVETAIRLTSELVKRHGPESVVSWVGRMRPHDLKRSRKERPGLFTIDGDDAIKFLVATQTVEVGVDIDVAGLVTELASGPALAQRIGRVNRLGQRMVGPVAVVGPAGETDIADQPPYRAGDLSAGRDWIVALAADPGGASPWNIFNSPPPAEDLRRGLLKRVELSDAQRWAFSSDRVFTENELSGDEDLALWLSDDLDPERASAGFVIRRWLPADPAAAMALLDLLPPTDDEIFPASLASVRRHSDRILADDTHAQARAFRFHEGDVEQLVDVMTINPGDVVIIDAGHRIASYGTVIDQPDPRDPLPEGTTGVEGAQLIHPDHLDRAHLLDALVGLEAEEAQQVIDAEAPGMQLLLPPGREIDAPIPWLALVPEQEMKADAEWRQVWSQAEHPVPLDVHNERVGNRAAELARGVGLVEPLESALRNAGFAHDLGKRDRRFQREVLANEGNLAMAKSGRSSAQQTRRDRGSSSLPRGWRHEQLSVGLCPDPGPGTSRELVWRLVGTSHGRVGLFPHTGEELWGDLDDDATTERLHELFTEGEWLSVLERTSQHHGVWGMAYLEAVLRAADGQVSGAGS